MHFRSPGKTILQAIQEQMHKILAPCIVIKLPLLYPAQKRLCVWECGLQMTLLWRKQALRGLVCVLNCVSVTRCELYEASCSCWRLSERALW